VVILLRDYDHQSELIRSSNIKRVSTVQGSLEDMAAVHRAINEHEIDTVFHLGAQTIVGSALRNPLATFEANIRGTYHLLEACRLQKDTVKRIVVASSDKAYGSSPVLPYTEEMPLAAKHPYDVSKSCTDLISQTYHRTYGLPIVIARCGNIFGGGDLNWSRLIPGTIRSLYFGEEPQIRSDGKFTRDYVFVDDVVSAYLMLAQNANHENVQGEAFNFGPNSPYTVIQIVEAIQKLMGKLDIRINIQNKAEAEIKHQSLSSAKAKAIFNWKPLFTLEEGLAQTIKWYETYLQQLTLASPHERS